MLCIFFSSRRRHTRCSRDWSSDVCSSDLYKRAKKAGLPPGSLVYTGEKVDEKVSISIIDYDEHDFHEREITTFDKCLLMKDKPAVPWIKGAGIQAVEH